MALCCQSTLARPARLAGSSPAAAQRQGLLWQQRRRQRQAAAPPAALPPHLPLLLADAAAYPAAASEAFPAAADTAAAAFPGAAAAVEADPTDLLFTALFSVAIAALVVVTLGVAYLSYTSWNDNRLEEEDRKRVESFRPSASRAGPAAASKKPKKEKEEEFKGFGKK